MFSLVLIVLGCYMGTGHREEVLLSSRGDDDISLHLFESPPIRLYSFMGLVG